MAIVHIKYIYIVFLIVDYRSAARALSAVTPDNNLKRRYGGIKIARIFPRRLLRIN